MTVLQKDSSWIRQAFLTRADQLDKSLQHRRIFTTGSLKFTDTTPGGNVCINPPPQFNKTTDCPVPNVFNIDGKERKSPYNANIPMGRYYSEAIDDNNQIIHIRFGVPKFNSLTSFFTGFYSNEAGYLARTGRAKNGFYMIGKIIGSIVPLLNIVTLSVWVVGHLARILIGSPSSKFYSLKPTMPVYWNAVQTMVNQIAVNRRIIPRVLSDPEKSQVKGAQFNAAGESALSKVLPDIFRPDGGIDVYAVANKAQRLATKRYKKIAELTGDNSRLGGGNVALGKLEELRNYIFGGELQDNKPTYDDYIKRWQTLSSSQPAAGAGEGARDAKDDTPSNSTESNKIESETEASSMWEFLRAELEDGASFASFRVNATGSIGESFSNSVGDSELQGKINGMASSSRSTNFSLANGNLSDNVIGKAIGGIISAAGDVVAGLADGLGASGLAVLGGGGFVDIPKHWQSSAASLPRATYTIRLTSPYANPISQLINIYIPLCMLLAGALPLSTGRQSYTSPFILELFDKGRCQTRLGIIDSLTVTRGTSNLSFNQEGDPLAIDVSFSIMDLSSIMHMPINTGLFDNTSIFDDGTPFTDYMNVLSSMDLKDQIYMIPKFMNNLTKIKAGINTISSTAYWASYLGQGNSIGRTFSALFRPVDR